VEAAQGSAPAGIETSLPNTGERIEAMKLMICLCGLLLAGRAHGDVKLPAIFSDHMVLQKSEKVPVWGKAEPGESVKVSVAGVTAETKTGTDGKWKVVLNLSQAAAGPHTAVVEGKNRIEIQDVLVGEVWLCSGQSNMQMAAGNVTNAALPSVRLFQVAVDPSLKPMEDCRGKWMVCTPDTAKDFSAIGFFFARRLHRELGVPVGVIEAAQGGTGAEQWISREGLAGEPALKPIRDQLTTICERAKDWDPAARHEHLKYDSGWASTNSVDDSWLDMELPQTWQNAGYNINGQIYFRKQVAISAHWVGKELTLSLGPIKRFDQTLVNGVTVGSTEEAQAFRKYAVPGSAVRSERLLITIRTANGEGFGGFFGRREDLYLALANAPAEKPVSLAGPWRFTTLEGNYWITTSLFNGMIRPLIPFAIKGVLWYQGESNAGWFFTPNRPEQWPLSPFYGINRGRQYRVLFPALIRDWRKQWGQDFPFLYVQLPNQTGAKHVPSDPGETNEWSDVREAQAMTLALPHTGMAVTFDLNHEGALHPTNKAQFSERLENLALAKVYGKSIVCDSPLYESFTVEGAQIRIKFRNVTGGLVGAPGQRTFTIAGADRQWKWATATIEGETLVVSSPEVPQPVAVRYGWPQMGPGLLFATDGLPVSPFRTDDWPEKP